MKDKVTPIGWGKTILGMKDAWNGIMTIKHSPLRNLPPQLGLMVFSILAIMWSGIFASIIQNPHAFGISAGTHLLVIFGIFITAIVYDSAEKYTAPQNYNTRGLGGEHE
jgi:apolipoprotein N-acyltransferase|tara:strand:- start:2 stop:328 length:327 start_codon:yes stop_codon:yes gene_type:complete